jgi:hypothetical protein
MLNIKIVNYLAINFIQCNLKITAQFHNKETNTVSTMHLPYMSTNNFNASKICSDYAKNYDFLTLL